MLKFSHYNSEQTFTKSIVNYSTCGHFSRPEFTWEKTDKVEELKRAVK